jgi:hypothetical protein
MCCNNVATLLQEYHVAIMLPHCCKNATHSHIRIFKYSNIHIFTYSSIQIFIYSHIQVFKYSYIHIFTYSHIHIFTYSHIQVFKYSYIHIFKYSNIHIFTYSHIQVCECEDCEEEEHSKTWTRLLGLGQRRSSPMQFCRLGQRSGSPNLKKKKLS